MKRILALTLSLAMLAGLMTVSAGAAEGYAEGSDNVDYELIDGGEKHENQKNTNNGGGMIAGTGSNPTNYDEGESIASGTINVTASINDEGGSITHVYAVSINTTSLSFTYGNNATSYIWNPSKLQYDLVTGNGGDNGWSNSQSINVTNYSDLPVDVTAEYQAETGHEGISATFSGSNTLSLDAATDGITGTLGTGTKVGGTFTMSLTGTPGALADNTVIGTVTLTFSKPTTGG